MGSGVERLSVSEGSNSKVWEIKCGQKRLVLELLSWGRASVKLNTIEGEDGVDGETTTVFTRVKELLENEVENYEKGIHFEIKTRWPRMVWWVENTGKSLFKWDRSYRSVDDAAQVKAEVWIRKDD